MHSDNEIKKNSYNQFLEFSRITAELINSPFAWPMREWLTYEQEHIVVMFDMCSSTEVFANLLANGQPTRFLDLLDEIRSLLYERSSSDMTVGRFELPRVEFTPVKFTGDGWLLLFPLEIDGLTVLKFLHHISLHFATRFRSGIKPYLTSCVTSGLRFGMDCGSTWRFKMFGTPEYLGAPVITAARLQEELKPVDRTTGDGLLISRECYENKIMALDGLEKFKPEKRRLSLRAPSRTEEADYFLLTLPNLMHS